MEINWDEAPEWADRIMKSQHGDTFWCNNEKYVMSSRPAATRLFSNVESDCAHSLDCFELVEARPGVWEEGEERMNNIGPNGNEGEHYDAVSHPEHYQSENGIECIDAIRASLGLDGFVAYCRGNAIKYSWRSGKKANHAEDLRKAAWYLEKAASELDK